jgi:hypothetical protein
MSYDIRVMEQPRRPIAAAAATTTWPEPARRRPVRGAGRGGGEHSVSAVGAGQAVRRWWAEQGREITGENWEVYGDWHEDPAELETEVFYRLRPDFTETSSSRQDLSS